MPVLSGSYDIAIRSIRRVSPLLARADAKIASGIRGREEATARLRSWALDCRDESAPLVWTHAPSVGEGLQARAVLSSLLAGVPELQAVYTFFSPSAERLAETYPADVCTYLPWDVQAELDALLEELTPSVVSFTKTEVWPGLTAAATGRDIPVILCAATLAEGAGRLRLGARQLLRPTFSRLSRVLAIASEDAERFALLGVGPDRIDVTGDPGVDSAWMRAQQADPEAPFMAPFLSDDRPTLVAGSTWPSDEDVVLPAVKSLKLRFPHLRAIIAPHEPSSEHLDRLEAEVVDAGMTSVRLSHVEAHGDDGGADVVVVDRIGVLAHLYMVGQVAYVGGGFRRAGLHSVLEPAAVARPVLFGPGYGGSRAALDLAAAGGGTSIPGVSDLVAAVSNLLEDPYRREQIGAMASGYIERHRGAAEATARILAQYLQATQVDFGAPEPLGDDALRVRMDPQTEFELRPPDPDPEEIPEISVKELSRRLEEGDELALVDVREPHEREIADLPEVGQMRIPLGQLLDRTGELERSAPLILYCRSGSRSGWATRELRALGFQNVWNLKGGLLAWKADVDPSIQAY